MPAQLLALSDGPSILLDKPIMLFGRHAECDIQLNSRKVSRRHCCIAQVHDYLVVRDLGSTNGIRINDNRLLEGKLHEGDELTIGNFKYRICLQFSPDSMQTPLPKPVNRAAQDSPILSRSVDQLFEEADEPIPVDESIAARRNRPAKPGGPRGVDDGRTADGGTISDEVAASVLPGKLK